MLREQLVPKVLLETVVSFNGVPAPLFYVSPNQINAQVPFELPPGGVTVQVSQPSSSVVQQSIVVASAAPGIFTINQQGTGAGVILHAADFSPVSETSPAHPGEFISIYCTGLGQLKSLVADGTAAPNPPPETVLATEVRVGNIAASVTFSGLAPGFVGLNQINVVIPADATRGTAVPIQIESSWGFSGIANIPIQ